MKYFRIINLSTGDSHYVYSDLPNESSTHVAMSAHLDPQYKYYIEEVSKMDFFRENPGIGFRDRDVDDDSDHEDERGIEYWD